jgi:hypothetical protein
MSRLEWQLAYLTTLVSGTLDAVFGGVCRILQTKHLVLLVARLHHARIPLADCSRISAAGIELTVETPLDCL